MNNGYYPVIAKGRIFKYTLPLHDHLPLKTTQLDTRCGLIIELTSQVGKVSYGEAAPLPDFSSESLADTEGALKGILNRLLNGAEYAAIAFSQTMPSVAFAVESALWGLELTEWLPAPVVAPLLLRLTDDITKKYMEWGALCPAEFKLKVARSTLDKDVQSVVNVLNALPDHVRLRLDANQRWTLNQAVSFFLLLAEQTSHLKGSLSERIVYIEEPTKNPQEFFEFYRETGVGYALDESLQQGRRPKIGGRDGLRAIVLKPTLTGGLADCFSLLEEAQASHVRVVFSSAFETTIGIHWLQQLSAFWTPQEMPGLDTSSVFLDNLVDVMPAPGRVLPDSVINTMELLWELNRT